MSRIRRILDWRFVLALCVTVLSGALVLQVLVNADQLSKRDDQINQLIKQADEGVARRAADRDAANKERAALLNYIKEMLDKQERIRVYLQDNGITVPEKYSPKVVPPSDVKPLIKEQTTKPPPQSTPPVTTVKPPVKKPPKSQKPPKTPKSDKPAKSLDLVGFVLSLLDLKK